MNHAVVWSFLSSTQLVNPFSCHFPSSYKSWSPSLPLSLFLPSSLPPTVSLPATQLSFLSPFHPTMSQCYPSRNVFSQLSLSSHHHVTLDVTLSLFLVMLLPFLSLKNSCFLVTHRVTHPVILTTNLPIFQSYPVTHLDSFPVTFPATVSSWCSNAERRGSQYRPQPATPLPASLTPTHSHADGPHPQPLPPHPTQAK